jgi:hypothetical protein
MKNSPTPTPKGLAADRECLVHLERGESDIDPVDEGDDE